MEHNNVFGYARFRGDKVYDLTPTKAFYVEDISGLYNVLSIMKNNASAPTITVEKSTDGITWESMGTTSTTAITAVIPAYGKLYLRALTDRWGYTNGGGGNTITASGRHNVGGNILSLLHGSTFTGYTRNLTSTNTYAFSFLFYGNTNLVSAENLILNTSLAQSCYLSMFYNCTSLTTAPSLPATTSTNQCYRSMFYRCTSLTTAPALPATTLDISCYNGMFQGCTSLTTAPALPATTLTSAQYCYGSMFQGCTSLTTAPALPATTLANYCYQSMFQGCTSLTAAPSTLPATKLAIDCYASMFQGCTSLTTAPTLPATTLAQECYTSMFKGCTSLTTAPTLPATTLIIDCYQAMFSGCTALITAPSILPATTLATTCYQYMFYNCTSLTTAPTLPATTLTQYCYQYMFYGCSSLNYIRCLATSISARGCLGSWVSGVASTGTFVKDANMTSWPTGSSGIPSGWIVRANGTVVSQNSNVATILTGGCDSGTAYYTINGGSHIAINQDTTTIPITQAMNGQTLYVYAEYAGQSDEKTLTLSWIDYSPAVTISVSDNYATITSATADTILYRLGSSGNYSTYTSPIYIAETTTLYVQATKTVSGVDYTTNTSQNVTHTAIPPTNLQISCSNNTVTISANNATTIQYRFSTSDPWTTYTAPFAIIQTVTVYAQASNNDGTISGSQECVYVTIPSAPTGLVSTLNGRTIDLSWNASSGATSYEVYRSTTASGTYTLVTTVTTTSASINALSGDNYIKVKAVNNIGSSDFSTYTYQNYTSAGGFEVFASAVNTAYPNRLKHLHQNYSVNEDGLYYVTVESGTSNGSSKTLVVGDDTGILTTKTVTVSGWGGYMDRNNFAYHGYFGFVGRTADGSGSNTYLSIFKYENGSITNIQTGTSINVKNWLTADISCFTFDGDYYIQGRSNSSRETFFMYNLTDRKLIRNEISERIGGCGIGQNGSNFVYLLAGVNDNSRGLAVCQTSNINTLSTTAISNTLSAYAKKTYRKLPVIGGDDRCYVWDTDFYRITISNDYSTISVGSTAEFTLASMANINYGTNFIFEGNDRWYYNSSTKNIEKVI